MVIQRLHSLHDILFMKEGKLGVGTTDPQAAVHIEGALQNDTWLPDYLLYTDANRRLVSTAFHVSNLTNLSNLSGLSNLSNLANLTTSNQITQVVASSGGTVSGNLVVDGIVATTGLLFGDAADLTELGLASNSQQVSSGQIADDAVSLGQIAPGTLRYTSTDGAPHAITSATYETASVLLAPGSSATGYTLPTVDIYARGSGSARAYAAVGAGVVLGEVALQEQENTWVTMPLSNYPSTPCVVELQARATSNTVYISCVQWTYTNL